MFFVLIAFGIFSGVYPTPSVVVECELELVVSEINGDITKLPLDEVFLELQVS
jgi:hypothetical protein